jgi:hypothetical protein
MIRGCDTACPGGMGVGAPDRHRVNAQTAGDAFICTSGYLADV